MLRAPLRRGLPRRVIAWSVGIAATTSLIAACSSPGFYRRIRTEAPPPSGTTGNVEISLAELLLDTGRPADRDEALKLLSSWLARDHPKFDSCLSAGTLALIRLAEATGDRETVRHAASTALELANRGPQLPRHKDVGLVKTDCATLERLRKAAK